MDGIFEFGENVISRVNIDCLYLGHTFKEFI